MLCFFGNGLNSGEIRARQVAEYLNTSCVIKATEDVEGHDKDDDVCVFVKQQRSTWARRSYLDVLDAPHLREWLRTVPDVGVITFTELSQYYLQRYLGSKRSVVYIPQHHCNFDRYQRPDREVRTVGYIGGRTRFAYPLDDVTRRLKRIGLRFKTLVLCDKPRVTREQVVKFYLGIDIQIYSRPKWGSTTQKFQDSLKIVNAGSFGIPTVAPYELNDAVEFPGCRQVAPTIDDMLAQCRRMKEDRLFYDEAVAKIQPLTERFHISRIAPRYLKLT